MIPSKDGYTYWFIDLQIKKDGYRIEGSDEEGKVIFIRDDFFYR